MEGSDYLFTKVQKLFFLQQKGFIVLVISSLYTYVVYKLSYISISMAYKFPWHKMEYWPPDPPKIRTPHPPLKNLNPLVLKIFKPIPT